MTRKYVLLVKRMIVAKVPSILTFVVLDYSAHGPKSSSRKQLPLVKIMTYEYMA